MTASEWVPVALSSAIEPGTSAGTAIDGYDVVVWRDEAGSLHVWQDRCPHRGMRMSFGFVRGDHIACFYHGWQYDTAGQCRHIPAHPSLDVPQSIRVPVHSSTERNGIVWASIGDERPLAEPPGIDTATVPVRSLYFDRPQAEVLAALLAQPGIEQSADRLLHLTLGTDRLMIAVQAQGAARTALHIVLAGHHDPQAARESRKRHALWAEAFRNAVEALPERPEHLS